jgi:protoporphyrinogen oxidase
MANKQPIIVVGAGIAGLTAAFRLQQNGFAVAAGSVERCRRAHGDAL